MDNIKDNEPSLEELMSEMPEGFNNSESDGPFVPAKKGNKLTIKIIASVIGLVLISGGVVLASRAWDPVWNPFRPSPEKVLEKLVDGMEETKSLAMKMIIEVSGEEGGFSGIINSQTKESLNGYQSKGDFEIGIRGGMMKVSIFGEFIEDENSSFVRFNKLPDASLIGMDFSFLSGAWISLEKEENDLDEETIDKITSLIERENLIIVKKELPNEKIGKTKVYHYIIGFDESALRNMVKEIINDMLLSSPDSLPIGLGVDDISEEELNEAVEGLVEVVRDMEMDIWIGIKDNLLHKLEVSKEIVGEFSEKVFFSSSIEFSKFNEPVEIEIPTEYKSMEEIMMTLMFGESMMEDSESPFDRMRRATTDFLPVLNLR